MVTATVISHPLYLKIDLISFQTFYLLLRIYRKRYFFISLTILSRLTTPSLTILVLTRSSCLYLPSIPLYFTTRFQRQTLALPNSDTLIALTISPPSHRTLTNTSSSPRPFCIHLTPISSRLTTQLPIDLANVHHQIS